MKFLSVAFAVCLALAACVPSNPPNAAGTRMPSANNNTTPAPTPYKTPIPGTTYKPGQTYSPGQTIAPTTNPGTGSCIEADAATCTAEEQATNSTNAIRAKVGRSPVLHDAKYSAVARYWSKWQHDGKCEPSFFGGPETICHDGFTEGARSQVYIQKFGSKPNFGAENVAMTSSGSPSSAGNEFVNRMWVNSSGHYTNMVGSYSRMGNGIYCGQNGCFGTQIFGN